jgi:ABC-type multidrug transport system fused ATPase/permease subunit
MPRSVIESVVLVGLVALIVIKLVFGDNPADIVPLLGVLALAAFRLMPCVNRSVISLNDIRYGLPLFRLVYPDLVNIVRKNQTKEEMRQEQSLAFLRNIEIKDLAFAYDEHKPIWDNVSFTIKKGDFVGIIGPSGAGKTTFVDVFLGLLIPMSGTITMDGVDVSKHLQAWQSKLAYVAQSIFLIDGTIAENVAFGEIPETMDYERIRKALDMAELLAFVDDLPDGIQTYVGENGVKLSGGQRQRIGIARALYQEPEILVLDEATSALDDATENAITETLLKLKGRITIIAIAHRLSTLDDCNFKVEFSQGRARMV